MSIEIRSLVDGQVQVLRTGAEARYFQKDLFGARAFVPGRIQIINQRNGKTEEVFYLSDITEPAGAWTEESLAEYLNKYPYFYDSANIQPVEITGQPIDTNVLASVLPNGAATEATLSSVNTNLGAQTDSAASSDTGTFSLISLFKRLLQSITSFSGKFVNGNDIGDVTINNIAGAGAVPIQDGGNSITIDATSLPLPTGAATEARQATGNITLASILAQLDITQTAQADLIRGASSRNLTTLESLLTRASLYHYQVGAVSQAIKAAPGILKRVIINDNKGTLITLYDNPSAASGSIIASINPGVIGSLEFDVPFVNGLFLVTTGSAINITLIYQ